jgi:hypothetical protein
MEQSRCSETESERQEFATQASSVTRIFSTKGRLVRPARDHELHRPHSLENECYLGLVVAHRVARSGLLRHNGTRLPASVPQGKLLGGVPIGLLVPLMTSWLSLSFVKTRLAPAKISGITWAGHPYGRMATQPNWPNTGRLVCVASDHIFAHLVLSQMSYARRTFLCGLTLLMHSWLQ